MSLNCPWNLGSIKCNDMIHVYTDVSELPLSWAEAAWISVQVSRLWTLLWQTVPKAALHYCMHSCSRVSDTCCHHHLPQQCTRTVLLLYWVIKSRLNLAISHPTSLIIFISHLHPELKYSRSCHVMSSVSTKTLLQDWSLLLLSTASQIMWTFVLNLCSLSGAERELSLL